MSVPWDEMPAVVLDNGTALIKCGFAGDEHPREVFYSVVGSPRGSTSGPYYVGDDALPPRDATPEVRRPSCQLSLKYPMQHGIVEDWDGVERVWRKAFQSIHADPTLQALLLTECPMNPKVNREKMAQVVFENLSVPALQVQVQAVMTLYSVGRTEGCVLDSGDGVTHVVPVFEGHTVPMAVRRMDLAGGDLTEWMMELLADETGRSFTTTQEREVAREIKEEFCYVAKDFDTEWNKNDPADDSADPSALTTYTLPDGALIEFRRCRFACPEVLFQPAIADKPVLPLPKVVVDCINQCGIDLRRCLLHNIILCGGNTMFRGMKERMQQEIVSLVNPRVQDDVRVIAPPERKFNVWMGASILSSLTSFSPEWITRQEYDENGSAVVHKRANSLGFVER